MCVCALSTRSAAFSNTALLAIMTDKVCIVFEQNILSFVTNFFVVFRRHFKFIGGD